MRGSRKEDNDMSKTKSFAGRFLIEEERPLCITSTNPHLRDVVELSISRSVSNDDALWLMRGQHIYTRHIVGMSGSYHVTTGSRGGSAVVLLHVDAADIRADDIRGKEGDSLHQQFSNITTTVLLDGTFNAAMVHHMARFTEGC